MASDRDNASRRSGKHNANHVNHNELPAGEKPIGRTSSDDNTFEIDSEELPPGYFRSLFFLGSMAGIGLGLMAGVAGYAYAAPILTLINNDIGPVRRSAISPRNDDNLTLE